VLIDERRFHFASEINLCKAYSCVNSSFKFKLHEVECFAKLAYLYSGVAATAIHPQRWLLMWFPFFTTPEVVGDFVVVVASLKISQFIQLER